MTPNAVSNQISELVSDVLGGIPEPYSESVPSTNVVFWRIYEDENLLRRYHMLSEYRSINSRIAKQVALQTGQTEVGRSSQNKCPLIISETYALLGSRA